MAMRRNVANNVTVTTVNNTPPAPAPVVINQQPVYQPQPVYVPPTVGAAAYPAQQQAGVAVMMKQPVAVVQQPVPVAVMQQPPQAVAVAVTTTTM